MHKSFSAMKQINTNAPVQCTKTIVINAAPEKVWATITGINQWANWQTDITNPSLAGPLQPGSTFVWTTGGAKITSTLHTVEPYTNFGWTGKTFGMFAIHNWVITPLGTQTQVTVEESMQGLPARLFKTAFNKSLEKGMQHWLALLKATCEK